MTSDKGLHNECLWSLGPRGDEVKALASGHGRGKGQTEEEHRVQYDMCDTRVGCVGAIIPNIYHTYQQFYDSHARLNYHFYSKWKFI